MNSLEKAIRLVLLYHSGPKWDFERQQAWENGLTELLGPAISRRGQGSVTPTNEATTRNLCDACRAALDQAKDYDESED